MQKFLITGFSGFVSRYFLWYLELSGMKSEILGIDISEPDFEISDSEIIKIRFSKIDLLDREKLQHLIFSFHPQYVLHLASFSSVGFSWKNPPLSFSNNMNIYLNLVEVIREFNPECRILSVGSSEEYGNYTEGKMPLVEDYALDPVSPYAVARVSQEMLSKVYCNGYGLDIVMTRSFNHIGPWQKDIFVISSFARQLVEIKKGIRKEKKLTTGDTSVIRDFLDVRDVVDAYYRLFVNGSRGEVYNICSGTGKRLKELIDSMCVLLDIEVDQERDPNLMRPAESRTIIGSNLKLKKTTGWAQRIMLEQSLEDIIQYWYDRV